ncbi:MAG: prepilin-type N-terminal cleavage/methylation domain-containing protein [Actinomycetota bacterium]
MLKILRNRMQDDKGFTLIELMVVVLIIAILIAIAIPTFLGLRRRAQDRAAQSNLRNGMTAGKAFFTDDETYVAFDAAEGEVIEPSLTWVDGDTGANPNQVGVRLAVVDQLVLSSYSASGTYFCIADDTTDAVGSPAGTFFGPVNAATVAACTGGW